MQLTDKLSKNGFDDVYLYLQEGKIIAHFHHNDDTTHAPAYYEIDVTLDTEDLLEFMANRIDHFAVDSEGDIDYRIANQFAHIKAEAEYNKTLTKQEADDLIEMLGDLSKDYLSETVTHKDVLKGIFEDLK